MRWYARPENNAHQLRFAPRLASWNKADDPDQVRLRAYLDDTEALLAASRIDGPWALRLDVGLPTARDLLDAADLDNYAYPLAYRIMDPGLVSVWCTKQHNERSFVRIEAARELPPPSTDVLVAKTTASASTVAYKEQIYAAAAGAAELLAGPVGLELSFVIGPRRNWLNLWKQTIDSLDPILGRTYPDRAWHPRDGRITELGMHVTVDPAARNEIVVGIRAQGRRMSARLDGSIALLDHVLIHWPGSVDHGRTATVIGLGPGESAIVEIGRISVEMPTSRLVVTDAVGYCNAHQARRCTICGPSLPWVDPNAYADGMRAFRDDDAGYLAWLAAHPDGYVINIARSYSATTSRVHHAGCRTISGENPHGKTWTGPYVKVCAEHLAELEQWAINQVGEPIPPCGTCHPASDAVQPSSTKQTEQAVAAAVLEGRCEIHGPAAGSAIVEAWADDYIRFEHLPVWQQHLRDEIRSRCRHLEPSAGQVLHATFFGAKHPNTDVENVLLYYIDSFRVAGRNGIRFEHGDAVPPAPDGGEYRFCYRYALEPRSGAFTHWRQGRTLASFDWTDLGAFASDKKLAQVWLALSLAIARGQVEVGQPAAPETPFAVRVQVRPPHGHQPVWGGLVKGIFDGVICAFQSHTDTAVLPEVVARLAKDLPAQPEEIEGHLLDQRRAVLGAVHRLVSPYQSGVKWDPADHRCVAGELLPAQPVDSRWAIKGDIVELSR